MTQAQRAVARGRVLRARRRLASWRPLVTVCAWCGSHVSTRWCHVAPGTVSHGACPSCLATAFPDE